MEHKQVKTLQKAVRNNIDSGLANVIFDVFSKYAREYPQEAKTENFSVETLWDNTPKDEFGYKSSFNLYSADTPLTNRIYREVLDPAFLGDNRDVQSAIVGVVMDRAALATMTVTTPPAQYEAMNAMSPNQLDALTPEMVATA